MIALTLAALLQVTWPVGEPTTNVVVVVVDDLSEDDPVSTPNIDALAASGTRYTRAYSSPRCSPTKWMIHFGEDHVTSAGDACDPNGNPSAWPPPGKPSLASDFPGRSVLVGKWHLGRDPGQPWEIAAQAIAGFDDWRAGLSSNVNTMNCPPVGDYLDWTRVESGTSFRSNFYQTQACENVAIQEIAAGRAGVEPWMVFVHLQAAHRPFHAPPGSGLTGFEPTRVLYEAMVASADDVVGEIAGAVDFENTMLVVVGDNGTPQPASWGPPPSQLKTSTYEGGVKVPMVWAGVGSAQGYVEDGLVSLSDLREMIAARSGEPIGREVVFTGTDFGGIDDLAVVGDRWKYAELDGVPRLHDLLNDPDEQVNLATNPAYACLVAQGHQMLLDMDPRN